MFDPSEVGMTLEEVDDIISASAVGMVLEPEERPEEVLEASAVGMVLEAPAQSPVANHALAKHAAALGYVEQGAPVGPAPRASSTAVAPVETPVEAVPEQAPVQPRSAQEKQYDYTAPDSTWSSEVPSSRPRSKIWMWTSVSAGLTTALMCLGFLVTPNEEPSALKAMPAKVISYDSAMLQRAQLPAALPGENFAVDRGSQSRKVALRGRRNAAAGRRWAAISEFKKALDLHRNNRIALVGLGELYLRGGNLKKSVTYLRRAVRVEPRDAKAHFLLAEALTAQGRDGKAKRHYRLAAKQGYTPS